MNCNSHVDADWVSCNVRLPRWHLFYVLLCIIVNPAMGCSRPQYIASLETVHISTAIVRVLHVSFEKSSEFGTSIWGNLWVAIHTMRHWVLSLCL